MKISKYSLIALSSIALALPVSAAHTFTGTWVGAVDGTNAFQSSDGTSAFSSTTSTAGLWHDRSNIFAVVGHTTVAPETGGYQGQPSTSNEIIMTISGLTATMSYDIYVQFGVNDTGGGGQQNIDAGFASGSLTTLTEAGATDTDAGLVLGGTWEARERFLGTAVADGSGEIDVFVDYATGAERTVFNGLSYVAVPEPSAIALLGLGGLAFFGRRRRS